MKSGEGTAGRKIGGIICLLGLSLLAARCGWNAEKERYAARCETEKASPETEQETEEEREDADIYWELARERISSMLLKNESIERVSTRTGYELFSDEWYACGDRLTDSYLYMFPCTWRDAAKTNPDSYPEEDLTYMALETPRRGGDYKGYFIFSVWVRKTDHGVELGTDFHQKMFEYTLYECSKEHYEEKACLIGLSPSENWMWWYPLYDILGEPVVMVSVTGREKLEPLFRDACERMHERQKQVSGDLSQTVRFGVVFDDHSLAWKDEDQLEYKEFEKDYWMRDDYRVREQTYNTYMFEQNEVNGYRRWLEKYDEYYPAFYLDFQTGYDEEKQEIFQEMCTDRDLYVEMCQEKEAAKQEKSRPDETQQEEAQAVWHVKEGDSLWKIAWQQYGDGSLWQRIYEKNRSTIGEDGNTIFPGQVLELP